MRLALLQDSARLLDPERNLARIESAAAEAAQAGAELLLTPELYVFGYAPAEVRKRVTPEQVTAAHHRIERIAGEYGIGVVVSLPGEEAPDQRGITATLVDSAGRRRAHYQKVQLFGPAEKSAFVPGVEPPPVLEYGGLAVGLEICYDIEFPEMVRAAAGRGAELLLVPTALAGDVPAVPGVLVPARSLENNMTVAYANHVGIEGELDFDGRSLVAGPQGEVVGSLRREAGLLVVEVPGRRVPGVDEPWYLSDRRVELHRQWL